ncbi:hypothetical protein HYY70_06450 [Candidatus Woesearchaeota archaeon]|nr:hypothetical protein [Candidatus Woesearchaeota archaeon]
MELGKLLATQWRLTNEGKLALESVTLPLVLTTAVIDSINPCAIGVLLLLIAVLVKHSKEKPKMLKIAAIYISAVFIVYLLSGLGLIGFQSILIKLGFAKYVGIAIGILVVLMGFVEIKDFFWYGRGFSLMIPARYSEKIKLMISHVTVTSAIGLGAFVSMVELPCTGGPYLAITTLLAKKFDILGFLYLILYNLIFVLPLVIIVALAYYGVRIAKMRDWKEKERKWMRLAAGIVMVLLGVFLIYYYAAGVHL